MPYITGYGITSNSNSSALSLISGGNYTGSYEVVSTYASASVLVVLGTSEFCTLTIDFSSDISGTNKTSQNITIFQKIPHVFTMVSKYFRISIDANLATAVNGYVQTSYQISQKLPITNNSENINSTDSALITSLFGKVPSGKYVPITATSDQLLKVAISSPLSAFGELTSVISTPVVQLVWANGKNSQTSIETISGGTITYPPLNLDGNMVCSSGTANGSYAIVSSTRRNPCNTGVGVRGRMSAIFTSGVANTVQVAGWGDSSNGYFYGYNGIDFGILYRRNGLFHIVDITINNTSTGSGNIILTLNSVPYTITLVNNDTPTTIAYKIATSNAFFGTWEAVIKPDVTGVITFISNVSRNLNAGGTYTITGQGITGTGFAHTNGVTPTETWIPKSSWNIDVMDGLNGSNNPSGISLDPTKGNVYQAQMQWLGYGNIKFFIENPTTGTFSPVHQIQYAGTSTKPLIRNQELKTFVQAVSNTTNSVVSVRSASMAISLEGPKSFLGPKYSSTNFINATYAANTIYPILVIQNLTTLNGIPNVASLQIRNISINNSVATAAFLSIYVNPLFNVTTAAAPTFALIDPTRSCASVWKPTAITIPVTTPNLILLPNNGISVYNSTITVSNNLSVDVTDFDIFCSPGMMLCFAVSYVANSAANTIVSISVNWNEFTS